MDWKKIKAEGYTFAFIKATEGGDFNDKRFTENWRLAKEAGVVRGAYHFFTFCRPGGEQAKNFLEQVPLEEGSLPFVLDLEFGGNCKTNLPLEKLLEEIRSFLALVQSQFPATPIFYVTKEFYDHYMVGNLEKFPPHSLWLRDIFFEPKQAPCERWKLWQFANRGRSKAIPGPVDLNVFCGDEKEFQAFLNKRG